MRQPVMQPRLTAAVKRLTAAPGIPAVGAVDMQVAESPDKLRHAFAPGMIVRSSKTPVIL
jgi:hypothetical protein